MEMSSIIKVLEKTFDKINSELYHNELKKPIITVQTGRRTVLGWCSASERWINEKKKVYEINIVAENLNRTKEGIIETLLHEVVHLYNSQHGVDDCNSQQYHNKHFKEVAEAHGLNVEKMKNRGFAYTTLNEVGKKFADSLDFNFDAVRMSCEPALTTGTENGKDPLPKAKKTYDKPVTYECPCCKRRVRFHNYKLNIICGDCGEKFVPIN